MVFRGNLMMFGVACALAAAGTGMWFLRKQLSIYGVGGWDVSVIKERLSVQGQIQVIIMGIST